MFFKPFHHQIKQCRLRRGLTQESLALKCGLSRTRLVQLESNYRNPTPKERSNLARNLGLYETAPSNVGAKGRLRSQGRKARGAVSTYFPPQDRATEVRYLAAQSRYRHFVELAVEEIKARPDFFDVAFLCSKIACDSRAEVLFLMALLKGGALPGLMSLSELGWTPHRAVDPRSRSEVNNRPQPCLILGESVFFFQVAFLTPRTFVVDVLAWTNGWSIIEIDGTGHNYVDDQERSRHLALQVLRIKPKDMLGSRFLGELLSHLSSQRPSSLEGSALGFILPTIREAESA